MRVCILSTVNIKHMTLVSLYTRYLEENNIGYDIIYIDKYHSEEQIGAKNKYKFELNIDRSWSKPRKALAYMMFKPFAIKQLKKGSYDFIITWNYLTALMFAFYLPRHYKGKYCLNIRDITTFPFVNSVIGYAEKKAAFSTVSSPAFIDYLPVGRYLHIHSMNMSILNKCTRRTSLKKEGEPIAITFIGYACFYEPFYRLIDSMKNDARFKLNFFGQGTDAIKEYALSVHAENVECIGRFEPSQTSELLNRTDMIFNLYGTETVNLRTALSIKLYYAIYLRLPILVFPNTYMAEVTTECKIGYVVDTYDDLNDKLYAWYRGLDFNELNTSCENYIEQINDSHKKLRELMRKNIH